MSPECRVAVLAAAFWLRSELGAELDLTWVPSEHASIALQPLPGQIAVTTGISDTDALSERIDYDKRRSLITLAYCSSWVVAHDIAHVLGIAPDIDVDLLMHRDSR